ncbi:TPA: lipopolysaccharide biosynthesis protein [Raoultella ornithinolytica]
MSKNGLIFKNTFFLAFRTILSLLVSLYTTRVILDEMGASGYGLFSVIYGAVGFFVFIVLAMNDSVQRFLSMKIGSDDIQGIKDIFKNSIVIYLIFGAVLISCLLCLKDVALNNVLNISENSIGTAYKIYVLACLSIFILVVQTPFNALVLSYEKMSFYAYMSIYDACSKLMLAFAITHMVSNDKVTLYSLLLLISSVVGFGCYVLFCLINFSKSLFGGRVNKGIIKEIYSFSFWNVLGGFASVSRIQGINILLNIYFSTVVNAAFAISNTVLNAINLLTQSLVTAIRPQIYKSYAASDITRYRMLILLGSKFTFVFLSIISLPIIINTNEILMVWLKNIPDYGVVFVRIIVFMALIDSLSFSIMAGIQATGKIRAYQLLVGIVVFVNLPITYILLKAGFSPQFIAFPLIITSLINLNLRVFFLVSRGVFSYKKYYCDVVIPCAIPVLLSLLILIYTKTFIQIDGIIYTIVYSALSSFVTMFLLWLFAFSAVEKKFCYSAIRKVFSILKSK